MRTATASATVPLEVSPWQRLLGVYVRWSSRNPWLASVLPFVPVVVAWSAIAKSGLFPPVFLPGPAGSLTIHNCRTLHYSARNDSDLGRPLLLNTMTSADAFPYTVNPIKPKHDQYLLRGKRAQFAHHDPRPCLMPPDWSKGYTSIFALQQEEEVEIAR